MTTKKILLTYLILCIFLIGCKDIDTYTFHLSDIIGNNVHSLKICSYKDNYKISGVELPVCLGSIKRIGFRSAGPSADPSNYMDIPGAVTMTIIIEYDNGIEQAITLPYYSCDDGLYIADSDFFIFFKLFLREANKQ